MISWIKGDIVTLWQTNNKYFVIVSCQNIGYEIQIIEPIFIKLKNSQISNKNIVFWLKHIKKEDSDSLFGFTSKDQKDFFNEILNIKGIGSQIGMAMLNKFSIDEIIDAIDAKDKQLIGSVQGIGQKMTERIILELKSSFGTNIKNQTKKNEIYDFLQKDTELNNIFVDLEITLQSLNYPKKEITKVIPSLIKDIKNSITTIKDKNKLTFEYLLKEAMNYLDKKNSNIGH